MPQPRARRSLHPWPPWALLVCLVAAPTWGQTEPSEPCPESLLGIWSTELPAGDLFGVQLDLVEGSDGLWTARLGQGEQRDTVPVWRQGSRLRLQSPQAPLGFTGQLEPDGRLTGFLSTGGHLIHLELGEEHQEGQRAWTGSTNLLGVEVDRLAFDLYVGREEDRMAGWFFFRDQRLPSLFGYGLRCSGDSLWLGEKNLDLELAGRRVGDDALELMVRGPGPSVPLRFVRLDHDPMDFAPEPAAEPSSHSPGAPATMAGDWPTAAPAAVGIDPRPIGDLVETIRRGELPGTHAVLMARHGRLAVEAYFHGFDRDTWHDMRSASKTVASILVGLAIDHGQLPGPDARALDYFPRYRHLAHWDPRKAEITLHHLLTMSSGLDADDSASGSVAAEWRYQAQDQQPDWMRFAWDAPMIDDPGVTPRYGTANPLLLGGVLAEALDGPVEWFAQEALFGPLGITHYRWFLDPTGLPYQGGGLYLRPRDMAKLGQIHLDRGRWQGRQILSEEWVRTSTARHGQLANVRDRNEYGYLWWHHTYRVGARDLAAFEARGNGGQYIFVVPELDLVAVITSGNYRNRELRHQPQEILERFLLPAVDPASPARTAADAD